MHYRRLLFVSVMAALTTGGAAYEACAQSTDPSQLEQVGRIQDSQDARRVALQRAQEQAQQQAAEQTIARQQAAARAAAQANARALAAKQAKEAQLARERQDDRSFLDANRSLDLQERQLKMKLEEARANHAEDYVHQELNQQQASVDIARSSAQGNEKLQGDVGKAVKMSQRHWWQWWD